MSSVSKAKRALEDHASQLDQAISSATSPTKKKTPAKKKKTTLDIDRIRSEALKRQKLKKIQMERKMLEEKLKKFKSKV